MRKTYLWVLGVLLILLVTFPTVSPAFADVSVNVSHEIKDVTDDEFPDIVFTATDALGNPQPNVQVELTPANMTSPLITGRTNSSGILIFENVPADNYTWFSSSGQSGTIEVKPVEIKVSEEIALLINFLLMEWCANSSKGSNGLSFIEGLQKATGFMSYPISRASDNYERAKTYYYWFSELDKFIDSKRQVKSDAFIKTLKPIVFTAKSALSFLGKISQDALIPPSIKLCTDGYKFNYLVDRIYYHENLLPRRHIFATRVGVQGFALIILALADLFVFQNYDFQVEVPLPEKLVTQTINIMVDFCQLGQGISLLTATIGRLCLHWGARASNLLLSAAKIFGLGACILQGVMIALDLFSKYKPWKSVMDYISDPDVLLNLADLAVHQL